jgi:hypothetical protein
MVSNPLFALGKPSTMGIPSDDFPGAINHGTMFWHAAREGLLANGTCVVRGTILLLLLIIYFSSFSADWQIVEN